MVKVMGIPVQPLARGVTVMVATFVRTPLSTAVKERMVPVPADARPITGLLLVQVKIVPATGPLNGISRVVAPLQYTALATWLTTGVGLTVIVNEMGAPVQPLADGVTVMVATTAVVPVLVAVKDTIFPVPLAASPIEGVLLLQENVVPATGPLNPILAVASPLQYVSLFTALTPGVGLTVMVNETGAPVQPLADGVTVMVAITGAEPVLVAEKGRIVPFPLVASPIDGVSLVQVKVVPATGPLNEIVEELTPLQYTALLTALATGVGFTVIVNETGAPLHPLADGVTVMVATTGTVPVLVAVKVVILPVPFAASPIEGVLLLHANVVPATGPLKVIVAVLASLQ